MPRAVHAFAAYVLITLAATWPLARGLGRDVPSDFGDPVLNMWILAWGCEQLRAILGGDLSRIGAFFDANIFHPAPLTLAYSEHLLAQVVQIFPVYLISGNPILCYNLLFLSTFVLSGLGMFLLVRELTGNAAAAFVSGLLFAFAPYRMAQAPHLTVLSSQWMPFVLYGLTRFASTRRIRPLAGAALALVAQALSSGYYLLYFTPFAGAYAVWALWRRDLWRDRRLWATLGAAGAAVAVLTTPFVLPYAELRSRTQAARTLPEVVRFSADVHSYATALPSQRIWGDVMQSMPKPEGELFPGLVPVLLALAGIAGTVRTWPAGPLAAGAGGIKPWLVRLVAAAAATYGALTLIIVAVRRVTIDAGLFVLRIGNVNRLLVSAAVALALLLAISPVARARAAAFLRTHGFFTLGLVAAAWLSLGPLPLTLGRPLEIAAPYSLLFEHLPGFEGLRVPARFAMIVAFMLAALAGYGAALLWRGRAGRVAVAVLAVFFLLEATHVPFPVNQPSSPRGYHAPEARLLRPSQTPPLYREVARLPADAVLVELPLGVADFDLRAMYYSTVHWRPLLNGYSGFFPPHYRRLTVALADLPRHPELSLQAMRASGATHAIVHEGAYLGDEGPQTSAALRDGGATELFRDGTDVLLLLPR